MIKVRLLPEDKIRVRLKPQQGIKVGLKTTYLYDPSIIQEQVDLAKDWAIKVDGKVLENGEEVDYSARAYAVGGTGTETNNSKYYAEQAGTSETNAAASALSASTDATNSHTWAEGTDEQVEILGGEHSSKVWALTSREYTFGGAYYDSPNERIVVSESVNDLDLAEVAKTGDYDDLINKPTIGDATLTIQENSVTVDTFKANATTDKTINITVPTQASDVNALPSSTKYGSSLSLSINNTTYVVTVQLKDQDGNNLGSAQTIDLPLESVVVSGSYDDATKKIILTLQNGSSISFSVADLVSGLQTEITLSNKLDADLVDDSTSTNKFVTSSDKTTWNGKQDAISDLDVIRSGASAGATALQPSALSGYATEQWVAGQGYLTEITSSMVTTALGYTPYDSSNPSGFITSADLPTNFVGTDGADDGEAGLVPAPEAFQYGCVLKADGSWGTIDYSEISNTPSIPTSADYWTVGTQGVSNYQTSYSKKMIFYKQANAQDNGFRMLADSDTSPTSTTGAWSARCLIGNEKRTFLLGTARNSASTSQSICGIGAHSWGSASSQTSAAWDNVYFQPDGSTAVYLGGNGWRGGSGWFRVQNSGSGSASYKAQINTGNNTSPAWKNILPNNATGSNSVLFTPTVGTTFSYTYATSVNGTVTADYGTSYGYGTSAAGYATALGYNAKATGSYSIQLGYGTNSTANTLSVGLSSGLNVELLDSTGVIPAGRLNIASSVSSASTNSEMVGAKLFYDTCGDIETLINAL